MRVAYVVGSESINLSFEGEVETGEDKILLNDEVNLLSFTEFNSLGYALKPFLEIKQFSQIKKGITILLKNVVEEVLLQKLEDFRLEKYHLYVTDEQHLKVSSKIKNGFHTKQFPILFSLVETKLSKILKRDVKSIAKHIDAKEFFKGSTNFNSEHVQIFNIRIVRPQKFNDNNPPHKDVWIERLKNAVNLYVPLCGSNEMSALPLVPGSHLIKESRITRSKKGGVIDGTVFTVPCAMDCDKEPIKLVRPNPKENEMMIFSPYLIHGGGYNFQKDVTRISLEMRFWEI